MIYSRLSCLCIPSPFMKCFACCWITTFSFLLNLWEYADDAWDPIFYIWELAADFSISKSEQVQCNTTSHSWRVFSVLCVNKILLDLARLSGCSVNQSEHLSISGLLVSSKTIRELQTVLEWVQLLNKQNLACNMDYEVQWQILPLPTFLSIFIGKMVLHLMQTIGDDKDSMACRASWGQQWNFLRTIFNLTIDQ